METKRYLLLKVNLDDYCQKSSHFAIKKSEIPTIKKFHIRDMVMAENPASKEGVSWLTKWQGPFYINHMLGNRTYMVEEQNMELPFT